MATTPDKTEDRGQADGCGAPWKALILVNGESRRAETPARARRLEQERRRERKLKLRFLLPGGRMAEETETPAAH